MVVLFQQYTENICFFSKFSAGGRCDWGILLVISLEFQGNKASTVFYDTANTILLCADVTDGKIGEKAPILPCGGDGTTALCDRAFRILLNLTEHEH